jgi:lysophospholipase L1-like esterase
LKLIEETRPEIVSIMLGTNDSISIGSLGANSVAIEEYASNMRKIIAKSKEVGAKVLLFEIPLVEEKLFAAYFTERGKFQSNECVRAYNRRLSEIAAEENIALLNHEWLKGEKLAQFFEPDGVHLSVYAHEFFAKAWLLKADKLIKGANI